MFDLTGSGAEPLRPDDPAHIGGIRLAGRLGTGGMGRVFLGVHEGRYVAVKQVLPSVAGEDQDFVRRFGHELDNLSRLPPEATAPLLASDRDARPPWLATAYVPGLTLSDAVRLHQGPLPAEAVWLLLREAAAGLVPVHALGMVHRDLKPSNVMLTVEGATVIDFGVARATEQSQLTRSGVVVGTPAYMAPEQAVTRRDLTGAVDVFALGSVIAYAAGGNPPFGEESGPAVLYRIVHEEPDLEAVRELDPALADLVTACLAKAPEARPTAAELVRRATEQGPSTAPLWPDSFSADLAAKAAFAAHVQEVDPPPPVSVETLNLGRKSGPKPPAERRRRTRVLLAVVPVVIAGGATLAVQLLPHISDADDPTGAIPSLSASAPTTPGTGPSGSASPATSAKDKEKDEKKDADGNKEDKDADKGAGQGNDSGNGADAPRHRGQGQRFRRLRRLQLLRRRWRLRPHRRLRRGRQAPVRRPPLPQRRERQMPGRPVQQPTHHRRLQRLRHGLGLPPPPGRLLRDRPRVGPLLPLLRRRRHPAPLLQPGRKPPLAHRPRRHPEKRRNRRLPRHSQRLPHHHHPVHGKPVPTLDIDLRPNQPGRNPARPALEAIFDRHGRTTRAGRRNPAR